MCRRGSRSAQPASSAGKRLNFIGPFGAIVACIFYSFLGAAAYLCPALLLGYGGAKLLSPGLPLIPPPQLVRGLSSSPAPASPMCSRCQLIDASRLNLDGEGGLLGKWIGGIILKGTLGSIGALIVLLCLYAVSLMLMTGLHPVSLVREAIALPQKWREQREAARLKRSDEQQRLAIEAERVARERKKVERTLARKGIAPSPEPASAPDEEPFKLVAEEEPPRPTPQIIDGTAPPPKREKVKKEKITTMATVNCENYEMPSLDLLDPVDLDSREAADPGELLAVQETVIETLAQFGISVSRGDITRGPTITRYEVYPAKGVRVDKIVSLERDLARATRAERINILAPIPGKDTVGIEIANSKKQKVTLRELLESDDFQNSKAKIPIALGKDVYGKTIIGDLAAMPHGLVAGTTGSGKSVCINAIIASILYRFTPEDLRLIMIDPKVVEMQMYNTLPHLVVPVVTDPKKVLLALRWAIDEMEKRYAIFAAHWSGGTPSPASTIARGQKHRRNSTKRLRRMGSAAHAEDQPRRSPSRLICGRNGRRRLFQVEAPTMRVPRDVEGTGDP
jgi:S-DNA-T family DNA segregation ATPase FtsK/SpoIIIE